MKDYLAEVDRLEEAISATHPCDARMYGLELCELVRDALKPVESSPIKIEFDMSRFSDAVRDAVRRGDSSSQLIPGEVMKSGPVPKGTKQWYEQGSVVPPPDDVTHVRDRDGEHWWRFEDGWNCTAGVDMPPSDDVDGGGNPWHWVSAHGPFEVARPKESYAHVEYTIHNPPPKVVQTLVDPSSEETIHRVPGTNRWRASGWDDYDVKTEGYDTFESLFDNLSGPFRAYTGGVIIKNMTPKLEWENGEDEPPHETFRAVVGTLSDGVLRTFWRDPNGKGWLKKQAVIMPDKFPADELISWENLLDNCGSVEEFRPGVAP